MLALDIRSIFKKYCLVVQEKETVVSDLVGEMVKMNLIDESVVPSQVIEAYEKKNEEARKREEELLNKLSLEKKNSKKQQTQKQQIKKKVGNKK